MPTTTTSDSVQRVKFARWAIAFALWFAHVAGCAALEPAHDDAAAVPVLMYHEIVTDGKAPGETVISLHRFSEQMRYIAEHGYHPISMDELVRFMQSGAPLPSRPVVLTFDDGWKNVLNAVPVLDRHGFKASFWIIAGEKGIGGSYLEWPEVQALDRHERFEVESHTVSHPWDSADNLVAWMEGRVPGKGQGDVWRELHDSKQTLEHRLQRPVKYLAWPNGWYNDALIAMAQKAGYRALLTAESGLNRKGDSPLRIKRTFIDGACDLAVFAQALRDGQYRVCQKGRPTTHGYLPNPVSAAR